MLARFVSCGEHYCEESGRTRAHWQRMDRAAIKPLGDAAVLVELGTALDQRLVERVWSACAAIRSALPAGVLDIVPAYGSIVVRFDPAGAALATIMACVRGALEREASGQHSAAARTFRIGVCFADECALDLVTVARQVGLSPEALIEQFCAPTYRVAFLGFTAGFPYLLGLPPRLNVKRLASPRTRVPAGGVAVAAGQCGIYPRATPGGWNILGRTADAIFNPKDKEPALFRPGDTVKFEPSAAFADAHITRDCAQPAAEAPRTSL